MVRPSLKRANPPPEHGVDNMENVAKLDRCCQLLGWHLGSAEMLTRNWAGQARKVQHAAMVGIGELYWIKEKWCREGTPRVIALGLFRPDF